jgi:hypothetical protein
MDASLLHVVAVYQNPLRWHTRLALYEQFEQEMLKARVRLTTVECQLGARPWQLSTPGVNYVRVRHHTILWHKENLLNLGVASLHTIDPDWRYVAWIDADLSFRRVRWALDTVHLLQEVAICQPWDFCYDMGPCDSHMNVHPAFCRQWVLGQPVLPSGQQKYAYAHPGYAWATRRETLEDVGGLIDWSILGAADLHMALGLVDMIDKGMPATFQDPAYRTRLHLWQGRALRSVNYSIGFMRGSTIEHHWHGRKTDRKYWERWQILQRYAYNPETDIKKNTWGVYEMAGNKPMLTQAVAGYFHARNEDANTRE